MSVPIEDYYALQLELENLREDHLNALQREVEAKMTSLHAQDITRQLHSSKTAKRNLEADLKRLTDAHSNLSMQLTHQMQLTERTLVAHKSPADNIALGE